MLQFSGPKRRKSIKKTSFQVDLGPFNKTYLMGRVAKYNMGLG